YIGNLYECTGSVYTKHIFAGGRRIASKTEAAVIYHHPDHLGGLHLATGSDGSLLQTATYYPFGENNEGSDSGIKYRFTGQEKDFESGLYYYGARYYDPAIGRFISPDTFVQAPDDPQTLNRYAYCRNNPLMYTDPTGHFWFAFFIGMAIGALMSGIQSNWNLQSMLIGGLIGGISGGVFAEVSGAVTPWLSNVTLAGQMGPPTAGMMLTGQVGGGMVGGAAAGATARGLGAAFNGGNIGDAMLSGAGYGALSGATFGGIRGYYGNTWTPARVGIQTLASGGLAELSGGNFKNAALFAFGTASAAYAYQELVGYRATWESGGAAVPKDRYQWPVPGANNIGEQGSPLDRGGSYIEGGPVSLFANQIPGINAVGGMHDTMQVSYDLALSAWFNESVGATARTIFSVPLMAPAAAFTFGALMADF
ncbi:MAG: RHS repeat-associated core domain-containing protein, partial [Syntrophobacter sp.]